MRSLTAIAYFAASLACLALPSPTRAQQPAQGADARQLFELGVEQVRAGDWGAAVNLFEQSVQLKATPASLFNLAVAYDRTSRPLLAYETAVRFAEESNPERHAGLLQANEQIRQRALTQLARLTLVAKPPETQFKLNEQSVPVDRAAREMVLKPGSYRVSATAPGFEADATVVELRAGMQHVHRVRLWPRVVAPPPTPVPARTQAVALAPPAVDVDRGIEPQRRRWPRWLLATAGVVAAAGVVSMGMAVRDTRAVERANDTARWEDVNDQYVRAPRWWATGGTLMGVGVLGSGVAAWGIVKDREGRR